MTVNPSLANDIKLMNVALFWNSQIGQTGSVILVSDDVTLLAMAKLHNLPAASLNQIDKLLSKKTSIPWTASVIRECMPTATLSSTGQALGKPISNKPESIVQELRNAINFTRILLSPHQKVYVDFSLSSYEDASSVILFGDFGMVESFKMKKRNTTYGIGIAISNDPVKDDLDEELEDLDDLPKTYNEDLVNEEDEPSNEEDDEGISTEPVSTGPQEWWRRISLPPRAYLFKFLIDNETWVVNPQLPVVTDIFGNTSNLIVVPMPASFSDQTIQDAYTAIDRWETFLQQLPNFTKK